MSDPDHSPTHMRDDTPHTTTKTVCSLRVPEALRIIELASPRWKLVVHTKAEGGSSVGKLEPCGAPRRWSQRLIHCKQALDRPPYHYKWYAYKGLLNPYEMVHVSSNRMRIHENVADRLPLSRSYFKMWEILHDFDLLPDASNVGPIRTAHFAEGPGGFIEAVAAWRLASAVRTTAVVTPTQVADDVYAGITLCSTRRDVPGWGKSKRVLTKYPQIKLHYGQDRTGDLYNVDNILTFARYVGQHACTLATGDGGMDYSVDFAHQEPLTFRLLLCQIYGAWLTLARGGAFVCKFFDMYEPFTIELMWMLAVTFDVVHVVKPHTSRPANSERYVVSKGFRGLPRQLSAYVQRLLRMWSVANGDLQSVLATPVPVTFRRAVAEYNEWYAERQCRNIMQCLALIDAENDAHATDETKNNATATDATERQLNYETLFETRGTEPPSLPYHVLTQWFPDLVRAQIVTAMAWCAKYNVPLNRANPRLSVKRA